MLHTHFSVFSWSSDSRPETCIMYINKYRLIVLSLEWSKKAKSVLASHPDQAYGVLNHKLLMPVQYDIRSRKWDFSVVNET